MGNRFIIFLLLCNFTIGIYAGVFFNKFYSNEFSLKEELPLENNQEIRELAAPHDWIDESSIEVYPQEIKIHLAGLKGREISWAKYADTRSMLPTFGKGCNGLEFVPKSPADIHVGDLVAFERDGILIIHRVVKIEFDGATWRATTKGDNNVYADKSINFDEIKFVTFGIIC